MSKKQEERYSKIINQRNVDEYNDIKNKKIEPDNKKGMSFKTKIITLVISGLFAIGAIIAIVFLLAKAVN